MASYTIIALVLLAVIYLIYDYFSSYKIENLMDRLNTGFETQDEKELSLWQGAANLLQLERIQSLLYESSLTRKFDIHLKRSGIKIGLITGIVILALVTLVVTFISYYYFGQLYVLFLALIITPLLIWYLLSKLANRQQRIHDNQLSSLITGLLTSMRAGGTPIQALQAISKNSQNPIKDSIANVMNNLQIGRSPNQVWQEWANYWDTKNTRLLSTGIRLKWESGGQMTTILEHIQETIEFNKRIELRVGAVTAQAKLSAIVLSLLPPGLAYLQYSYRPDLMIAMYNDELGKQLFAYAAISTIFGFLWLQKIAKLRS